MKNTVENLGLLVLVGCCLCCLSLILLGYLISERNEYRNYILPLPLILFVILTSYIKIKASQIRRKEIETERFRQKEKNKNDF